MLRLSSFEVYVDRDLPERCPMASPTNFVPPFPIVARGVDRGGQGRGAQ